MVQEQLFEGSGTDRDRFKITVNTCKSCAVRETGKSSGPGAVLGSTIIKICSTSCDLQTSGCAIVDSIAVLVRPLKW